MQHSPPLSIAMSKLRLLIYYSTVGEETSVLKEGGLSMDVIAIVYSAVVSAFALMIIMKMLRLIVR